MKKHRKITTGKKVRMRLRSTIRRLQKRIDALCAENGEGSTGSIAAYGMKPPSAAMIYGSEFKTICRYVLDYPNLETGGSLYGWYSENGLPIIAFATGPGKNATHEATRFHADEAYSMAIGRKMMFHGAQHLGEWHSHHSLGLATPSGIDCRAMQTSLCAPGSQVRRFLCGIANIVGDKVTFNAYFFTPESGLNYTCPRLVPREGESPLRIGLNKVLGPFEQEGAAI